jgi:hypothetical protein
VPVMQHFFDIQSPEIEGFIGWAGFLGISMAIVFMMSQPERSTYIWIAIALAFVIELFMNISSTVLAVQSGESGGPINMLSGIGLGIFIPCANLAFGEVLHNINARQTKKIADAKQAYDVEVASYTQKWQRSYKARYKRAGLSEDEVDALLRGDLDYLAEDVLEEPQASPTTPAWRPSPAALELARAMVKDGTAEQSYALLQDTYHKSPSTIRDAKRCIAENMLDSPETEG